MFTPEQVALLLAGASNEAGNLLLFERHYQRYDGETVENVEQTRYNLMIRSFRRSHGCDQQNEREWEGLRLRQITDRWWFFRRVACKMQLEEPLKIFDFVITRSVSRENKEAYLAKKMRDKVTAAKATVTKIDNAITAAKQNWNSLFPIEDDDAYQKAQAKLFAKRRDLADLEREYKTTVYDKQTTAGKAGPLGHP